VNFSGFYSSLSYIIGKGQKKGAEKGVKRARKGATVNGPIAVERRKDHAASRRSERAGESRRIPATERETRKGRGRKKVLL
jgi:hypothetical protein